MMMMMTRYDNFYFFGHFILFFEGRSQECTYQCVPILVGMDFRDIATFQKQPNFPFGAWTIVHGHQKI